jgi:broad specificity polyphosphatase/5'/3'-nucleotidase SurE
VNEHKIIDAYKGEIPKFEKIKGLVAEAEEVIEEKDSLIREIMKIYSIVFKNFSSQRLPTNVFINRNEPEDKYEQMEEVILNKDGLMLKAKSTTNATNLIHYGNDSIFRVLANMKAKQDEILPNITKIEKKNIFTKFIKNIDTIKELRAKAEMEFPSIRVINFNKEKDVRGLKIEEPSRVLMTTDENKKDENKKDASYYWNSYDGINTSEQGLDDMIEIEQLYEQITELYNKYINAEKSIKENINKVVSELKADFGDYLVLNNLKHTE